MLNIQILEQRLRGPLPGLSAHETMAPRPTLGRPPGASRSAAVLVLLAPFADRLPDSFRDLFVTLIRRTGSTHHSGEIAFPGGLREGSEPLVRTALREAQEEIGVEAETVRVLGTLSPVEAATSRTDILPVLGIARYRPSFRANEEVASLIHMPLRALLRPDARGVETTTHPELGPRRIPYFRIGGAKLWGVSAKIMAELLAVTATADSTVDDRSPSIPVCRDRPEHSRTGAAYVAGQG